MLIARKDHPALKATISFSHGVRLDESRGARKMLELASHGSALHTNSKTVFGLVECHNYAPESEDLFEVRFLGHYDWGLLHAGNTLMRVRYGQPYPPRRSEYEVKLGLDLPRIFKGISAKEVKLLISLVRAAEGEKHGTMLVISADASNEAKRLMAQGTIVEPQQLTTELLTHLTPIDGAVVIDPKGFCHAIGVILDGIATGVGNPSRGACYNSALRYVSSSKAPCLAVVVSEDGGVDLVPNLRPPIRRSVLDDAVQQLASIAIAEKIPRYIDILEWLSNHRFYLLDQDCKAINQSASMIEERLNAEDPTLIWIIRSPFEPNPEMDENLYYQAEWEEEDTDLTSECT